MTSGSSSTRYQLSSTLAGHEADVRALTSCPHPHLAASDDGARLGSTSSAYDAQRPFLFSTSRDGTARGWICRGGGGTGGGGGGWVEGPVFGGVAGSAGGHEGFVNAVEWAHASPEAQGGEWLALSLSLLLSLARLRYLLRSTEPQVGRRGGREHALWCMPAVPDESMASPGVVERAADTRDRPCGWTFESRVPAHRRTRPAHPRVASSRTLDALERRVVARFGPPCADAEPHLDRTRGQRLCAARQQRREPDRERKLGQVGLRSFAPWLPNQGRSRA